MSTISPALEMLSDFNSFVFRLRFSHLQITAYLMTTLYGGQKRIKWYKDHSSQEYDDDGRRWLNVGTFAAAFDRALAEGLRPIAQFLDEPGAFKFAPFRLNPSEVFEIDPIKAAQSLIKEIFPEGHMIRDMFIPVSYVGTVAPGITNADGSQYHYTIQDEINQGIAEEEEERSLSPAAMFKRDSMRQAKLPQGLRELWKKNQEMIRDITDETSSGDGYWVYLEDEFTDQDGETHSIHEYTVRDCVKHLRLSKLRHQRNPQEGIELTEFENNYLWHATADGEDHDITGIGLSAADEELFTDQRIAIQEVSAHE